MIGETTLYHEPEELKKNISRDLLKQFGEQLTNDIFALIESISGKDSFIDKHLWLNLLNILPLSKEETTFFIKLAIELSHTSAVVPVLLFEKIPTILFYNLAEEIGQFLIAIRNYGSRALAYYLGCDQLRIDDLLHILENSSLPYYKKMLHSVTTRHQEFDMCCSLLMRFSPMMEPVISIDEINDYLDVCSKLVHNFGIDMTEHYIKNAAQIITKVPLKEHWSLIEAWSKKSLVYLEFSLRYPMLVLSFTEDKTIITFNDNQSSISDIKRFKIELLKSDNYFSFLNHSFLFSDRDYLALMMNWPTLESSVKKNILFQLQKEHYKSYVLAHQDISPSLTLVNEKTNSNWLKSWTYCGEHVDLTYIRKRLGVLLQDPRTFSLQPKSIVKNHPDIFNRDNPDYSSDRILKMVHILTNYCTDETIRIELLAFSEFLSGNRNALRNILSQKSLVVQVFERDPWTDYGRSDELFSCTSLGEYNAANAPAFLADLNLNHLDIWNLGARVGRIHLCLIKNECDETLLLLDCVDGSERIIGSQKKFELLMSSVMNYARWLGMSKIKINYDVDYNTTPKRFIAYVERTFKGYESIEFATRLLPTQTTKYLLPYPYQTFTESFLKNNGAYIRGALISL